jgi:hypothetical protein
VPVRIRELNKFEEQILAIAAYLAVPEILDIFRITRPKKKIATKKKTD